MLVLKKSARASHARVLPDAEGGHWTVAVHVSLPTMIKGQPGTFKARPLI